MQWTVQVIMVLLNIAWIVFFLQPDPFSVSVQRRSSDSSDEEMLFRQFCIQPHPDMNWTSTVHSANITSNKTNTTAEERGPRKLTTRTSTQPNDIHTSQSSDIDLTSPSPGSTPQQIDWDETTPAPSTAQRLTSSEVTTASGFISSSSSEAAHVTVTRQSKPPVQEKDNEDPTRSSGVITVGDRFEMPPACPFSMPIIVPDCCYNFYPRRMKKNFIRSYYLSDNRCLRQAVIFVTVKSRHICVDPELSWVQSIMKSLDKGSC